MGHARQGNVGVSDQRWPWPPEGNGIVLGSSIWLRRQGLRGEVWATLTNEGLLLQGRRGGQKLIEPRLVQRMRSLTESSKYGPFFTTRLWMQGEQGSWVFAVKSDQLGSYVHAIGGLATLVAADGGLARLERGGTVFTALLPLILLGPLLPATLAVSIFALPNSPWHLRFLPTLVGLSMAVVGVLTTRSTWPGPVRDLDEYMAALAAGRRRR